jgi:hypothetical protein
MKNCFRNHFIISFGQPHAGINRNGVARKVLSPLPFASDFLTSTASPLALFMPRLLIFRVSISKREMFVGLQVQACQAEMSTLLQLYC